jgi:DNA adenine methylase
VTTVQPPLKWHGGKQPLASKIVALFPPHSNFVEVYAGGLAVLLAKDPEGVSEVVNDISGELTNFWRVLQSPEQFPRFQRRVEATVFSEAEWIRAEVMANYRPTCEVEWAWAFFVRCRQSLAGRMKSFAPISTSRRRRGMNEQASAWLTAVEGLPAVHERLKRVVILNRDGCEVIRQFDKPDTVVYLDPPYLPQTRKATEVYSHEMTEADHRVFLTTVKAVKSAAVAVSGYRSDFYDSELSDWRRVEFDVANHAAGGEQKRRMVEVVYCNW